MIFYDEWEYEPGRYIRIKANDETSEAEAEFGAVLNTRNPPSKVRALINRVLDLKKQLIRMEAERTMYKQMVVSMHDRLQEIVDTHQVRS